MTPPTISAGPLRAHRPEPSVHVVRARKLMLGGLGGGVGAGLLAVGGFAIADGAAGVVSALIAAGLVLFFYVVGQLVMVLFANAGAQTLLAVSLASYTGRVVVLGLVLLAYDQHTDAWPTLVPLAVFVTTIAVVAGWLAVEVAVFFRLRIDLYDTPYSPPQPQDGEQ